MTVGERLLELRKKKGISQEEASNILNVSRQTISKWETGESCPDFDKIVPLCELYGITPDELITGKKEVELLEVEDKKKKFAQNLGISVGLYIFSIVLIILFGAIFNQPVIGVCLFFIVLAIATGLVVYNAINYSTKKEKTKEDKTTKQVCEIIDILGVIIYFIVSFLTMAWHLTWIIFLIIGLCEAIAKLLFSLKENKEDKNNE